LQALTLIVVSASRQQNARQKNIETPFFCLAGLNVADMTIKAQAGERL